MRKLLLVALASFCFAASHAQTVKDTIQVEIAAVKSGAAADSSINRGLPSIIFNGYVVLETDKPNIYLSSRKVQVSGYKILYTNAKKWQDL